MLFCTLCGMKTLVRPGLPTVASARAGFTLIELIIVVAIIAIVAATIFIALDPAKQLHTARNSTRWADITSILDGIKKYQFENDGALPPIDGSPGSVQIVGSNVGTCGTVTCGVHTVASAGCALDLSAQLRPYMKKLPSDPKTGTDRNSRYYVNKDEYGLISVGACDSEGEEAGGGGNPPDIELTR